ncbi:sugar phosphate isomerase/epimerase family protein [Microbacterium sp. SSM24]|uniref:sugar phosphate isomerase/epimerase family protein n=1 Tax=Microbacterium sp. SSM24 TaxID=2991714 RepID=UPI0022268E8B|nr:sugar phosphate isomerase/epimerase [Microbacterium sp. SSM24]MCW3492634.1 sugar phosphate isomerase/epimerase [Microbacterium sp. SSM24]
MSSEQPRRIRLGTDLITFFDLAYWGIEPSKSYEEWVAIVEANPRLYFERMLDGCVEAGVEGIEFAPPPGGLETAVAAFGTVEALADALATRGLVVSSSFDFGGPHIVAALEDRARRADGEAALGRHADTLATLGADVIVLGSVPRTYFTGGDPNGEVARADIARVADEIEHLGRAVARAGVRLALHTDAYSVCNRPQDIDVILAGTSPKNVGLCVDAGHLTLDGSDAVATLRAHVDRVPIMHWKDCVAPLDGASLTGPIMERHAVMLTYFRVLGQGRVDWHEWQRILKGAQWRGWAIAEIDMSPDPIAEIRAGIEFFDRELAPIYG